MASSPKIDDLRKKFEENPRRYFAPLANEYRKAGDITQAIAICREYLPQQPGHMSGHIVFGQALYEARQLDEAKTVFETALSLDPENLIALKHLGDISLMAGDTGGARTWYNRVLEADPRNEETQAQLASLDAAGKPTAAPTPPAPVETLSAAKTTPVQVAKPAASSAPTVVMKAMAPPVKPTAPVAPPPPRPTAAPAAQATAESATTEIRLDGLTGSAPPSTTPSSGHVDLPATLVMEAPHGVTPVAKHYEPDVAQTIGLEATSMAGAGASPMDSLSLDGLETTSLSAPPGTVETQVVAELPALDFGALPAAAEAAPAVAAAATSADLPMLDLDLPAVTPAVESAPDANAPPAIDLDFGGAANATPAPAPAPAEEPPALEIADFALPEPSVPAPEFAMEVPAAASVEAPAMPEPLAEIDLGFAPPTVAAAPQEAATELPPLEIEVPVVASESGPFVTETMAELYLQQGHRDEALRVYRALLDQKPGDAALRAKVEGLEAPPIPAEAADLPTPVVATGPTIRQVLVLIAQRRPGYRPETNGTGTSRMEPASADVSYAAPEPEPIAESRWTADALGALWAHVQPGPAEENAALMLATAFADLNGMENAGAPGLDLSTAAAAAAAAPTVAVPAPTAAPSSFSFDKFFSQRVTAEHATSVGGPTAQPESKEDVAQFTRWLEGLKQQ